MPTTTAATSSAAAAAAASDDNDDVGAVHVATEAADAAADAAGSLFHAPAFLEQFVVQMLVPFSVVYLVLAHSWEAAANVLSVPRPFHAALAAIFATAQLLSMAPIAVLIAWTLRGAATSDTDASTAVLRTDVVALAAVMTMHRLAISIKYAFQPAAVYTRRMSEWVSYQERLDDQLFASWFKLSSETIAREVVAAQRSLDADEAVAAHTLPRARVRPSLTPL